MKDEKRIGAEKGFSGWKSAKEVKLGTETSYMVKKM